MRSAASRVLAQFAGALQQQQGAALGRSAGAACCNALHFSTSSERKQNSAAAKLPSPSVQALLPLTRGPVSRVSSSAHAACMAGGADLDGPTYVQPGTNPWTALRQQYGFEKKNALNKAVHLNILVFGFAAYLVEIAYVPPRILAMMGMLWAVLFVRAR